MDKNKLKLWIVRFYKMKRVMVYAIDIDSAKIEARLMRPDCRFCEVIEVTKVGKH